jgi:hypothetical protein
VPVSITTRTRRSPPILEIASRTTTTSFLFLDAAGVIFDLFTPVHLLILNGVRTTNSLVAGMVQSRRVESKTRSLTHLKTIQSQRLFGQSSRSTGDNNYSTSLQFSLLDYTVLHFSLIRELQDTPAGSSADKSLDICRSPLCLLGSSCCRSKQDWHHILAAYRPNDIWLEATPRFPSQRTSYASSFCFPS